MAGPPRRTRGGYDTWEVISALQKAIRRAEPELALYWMLELESVSLIAWGVARLRTIAQEDIGYGDPQAVVFANQALDQTLAWWKAKNDAWYMSLANAVAALAFAKKSRVGDEFQAAVRGRIARGWKPDIPDVALDKHTMRGKRMGRGMEHFLTEGAVLVDRTVEEQVAKFALWHDEAEVHWRSLGTAPATDSAAPATEVAEELPF